MAGSGVARRLAAAVAVVAPAALALWSRAAWGAELPETVGTHWSSPGPADRTTPTHDLFAGAFGVSAIAALLGATAGLLPRLHPLTRRLILLATGSVSAIAATQWMVPTWLTMRAGDPGEAVLGAWILIMFGAFAYGVLPSCWRRRPGRRTPP
ncbi:hypothetical protein [Leifsonia sp. P73]|uniref:hypothetical protein n=1 Tax=Leifsonia sp. P73 TaxID=3423959 RepID=UPI003DA1F68F